VPFVTSHDHSARSDGSTRFGLASFAGLTAGDVLEARRRHGPNDIVDAVQHPLWALARDTARDPMIWFFAGTSALYAVVGQLAEAATLLGAIVPLVLMDVFLHRRTQASTEGLKSRLASLGDGRA
jgi:Ca2+-transporting ATPase